MVKKIKFGKFGAMLGLLYKDTFSCSYKPKIKNDDGTTGYSDVDFFTVVNGCCKISSVKEDTSKTDDVAYNLVDKEVKVFCNPSLDVKKGNTIIAARLDDNGNVIQEFVGIANKPNKYATHQEIIVVLSDGVVNGNV